MADGRVRTCYVVPLGWLLLLSGLFLGLSGCGSGSPNGGSAPAERQREARGLGGPVKLDAVFGPEAAGEAPQVVAPSIPAGGKVREKPLAQGSLSWYRFTTTAAPFHVVTCTPLPINGAGDPDLYVLGPVPPRGAGKGLRVLGQSRRRHGLPDWLAFSEAEAAPRQVCHAAVHGYGPATATTGNGFALEYDPSVLLPESTPVSGAVHGARENAWFHFVASGGRYYRITLTSTTGDADLYAYAEDSAHCLALSNSSTLDTVEFWMPEDHTIFLRVHGFRTPTGFAISWAPKAGVEDPPPPGGTVQKLVLVGWDGAQRNHLRECLTRGELPHLAAMIARGGMVNTVVRSHRTDTKSGWTEILTGYGPDVTGVYSNADYGAIPEGLSVFERAKAYYQSQGSGLATIFVAGKHRHMEREPGFPWFYVAPQLDLWQGDVERKAAEGGPLMLAALDQYANAGPFLAFFHFADPDAAGHPFGENSPQYNDGTILCDTWLGKLLAKLEQLGVAEETRVLVTTDHGFDEGKQSHLRAAATWIVSDRPDLARDGGQEDVAPTLYTALGVPHGSAVFAPPLAGHSLTTP